MNCLSHFILYEENEALFFSITKYIYFSYSYFIQCFNNFLK